MSMTLEESACTPIPLKEDGFNSNAQIPCGCTIDHIKAAMEAFLDFIGFINTQLATKGPKDLSVCDDYLYGKKSA